MEGADYILEDRVSPLEFIDASPPFHDQIIVVNIHGFVLLNLNKCLYGFRVDLRVYQVVLREHGAYQLGQEQEIAVHLSRVSAVLNELCALDPLYH